jgi:hypothetical protein
LDADESMSSASTTDPTLVKRSLSTLLSQVLVAFTVEFDNEFEQRMGDAGYAAARHPESRFRTLTPHR